MLCVLFTLAAIVSPALVGYVSAQTTLPNYGTAGGERQRFVPERKPDRRQGPHPTTSNSSVVTFNGGIACQKVIFKGNILAFTSIPTKPGASSKRKPVAEKAVVTLDTNNVFICNLTPPVAMVNVGGRVTTPDGRGISKALIRMTDAQGIVRTAYTAPLGYYNFTDVRVGQNLSFGISHKSYKFIQPVKVISLMDRKSTLDFIASPSAVNQAKIYRKPR